jgi:ribonuclease G
VNKELIIRSSSDFVDFALLKKMEFRITQGRRKKQLVGFIAKIRKPVAGLNAAFVNVGFEKTPFYTIDLGPLTSQLKFIKLVSAGKIKISLKLSV